MASRQAPPGRIGRKLLRAIFEKPAARNDSAPVVETLPVEPVAPRELPLRVAAKPLRADDAHRWTDLPA